MPLKRNKTGLFILIEALPLMRLAAKRYTRLKKASKDYCSLTIN